MSEETKSSEGAESRCLHALVQRLVTARENLQWTQADLARATGLQPAAISHFETGQRTPNVRNLLKLAKALRVSTDWLVGLSDANPQLEITVNGTRYVPCAEHRGQRPPSPKMDVKKQNQTSSVREPEVRCTALVGASSVESEDCPTCGGAGYIITHAGCDGWPDTTESCKDCVGTGYSQVTAPTAKGEAQPPA